MQICVACLGENAETSLFVFHPLPANSIQVRMIYGYIALDQIMIVSVLHHLPSLPSTYDQPWNIMLILFQDS
jgi:hypothetical protein